MGCVRRTWSLQVTRENFLAGLKDVEPSATREFFIEKSETTFASLGGLDEVKRMLDAVVEHSHLHAGFTRSWTGAPRGILLVGLRERERRRWRGRSPAKNSSR